MKKILLMLMLSVSLSGFSQVVVEIPGPVTWTAFNFNNLFPNSSLTGTLTSVQIEGTLTNSVSSTFANDLTFYVSLDSELATNGLLQIGGFSDLEAAERRDWGCEPACDSSAPGTVVSGTVTLNTPIDFTGSTYTAWLGNGYGFAGTAGTFTNITVTLTGVEEVPNPTARLQVIHNSPDAAAAEVDVYVNGGLFIDNFAFRTNSDFVTAPAGVPLNIQIAPGNSESADDAIFSQEFTLEANETYILIANGIVSAEGYSSAPNFGLSVYVGGREEATDPNQTDILVNHGSPDAPAVDVVETSLPAGIIVDNISFPEFDEYLELPTLDFVLDVRPTGTSTTVASFLAPLETLTLNGAAITVIASGFLDPSQNSDGPAFGLFVAGATAGELIPLPPAPSSATARLQVIHNSPDAAAAVVDVYVNGDLFIDDFAFRTASPFETVPAGVELNIAIAPGNSSSAAESVFNTSVTLDENETYIVIANGIVSAEGYSTGPNFGLSVFAGGREAATNPAQTDILVNHGSPDAPAVDVVETSLPAGIIVDNISFPEFFDVYLELPTLDFVLDIRPTGTSTTVASFLAPLQELTLEGEAITVIASGFLDPSQNSDGPAFGLWVATAAGGALIPLPTNDLSINGNNKAVFTTYPNPVKDVLYLEFPEVVDQFSAKVVDLSGRIISTTNSYINGIDVSGLASGMYMLEVNADGASNAIKFVKK